MKKSTKSAIYIIVIILVLAAAVAIYFDRVPQFAAKKTANNAAERGDNHTSGGAGEQTYPGGIAGKNTGGTGPAGPAGTRPSGMPEEGLKAEKKEERDNAQGQAIVRKRITPPHPESTAGRAREHESEYDLISEQVKRFCRYLDEQDYIENYRFADGTYIRGLEIVERLSERRPVISGETENMATLTANIYHLYRAIGRKNIELILDVFLYERNEVEEAMDLIYRWLLLDMEQSNPATGISIEAFYEYGAFFLATLGGKSYLARRNSKTRILTTYYSILIVDKAESLRRNKYGINIRPHIQMLVDDIKNYRNLKFADWYLKTLGEISSRLNG
ncbi:MAG: hypothetical protein M0P57_09530 [Syntrophales bacterium]|jgi:hypothetical protein|nr:hypothetical protein [Syntrophales bacterium]MDY0043240.1 hypothetical protein [Syntrophales bacterium]